MSERSRRDHSPECSSKGRTRLEERREGSKWQKCCRTTIREPQAKCECSPAAAWAPLCNASCFQPASQPEATAVLSIKLKRKYVDTIQACFCLLSFVFSGGGKEIRPSRLVSWCFQQNSQFMFYFSLSSVFFWTSWGMKTLLCGRVTSTPPWCSSSPASSPFSTISTCTPASRSAWGWRRLLWAWFTGRWVTPHYFLA